MMLELEGLKIPSVEGDLVVYNSPPLDADLPALSSIVFEGDLPVFHMFEFNELSEFSLEAEELGKVPIPFPAFVS